jgi:hypothetical protein
VVADEIVDTPHRILSILGEIVIDDEAPIGPAHEDGLAECETHDDGMDIIGPECVLGVMLKT